MLLSCELLVMVLGGAQLEVKLSFPSSDMMAMMRNSLFINKL